MPSIAALSAAALLASLSAPLETPPDAPGLVSFAAGSSRWSGETGRYELEGGAVLRRGAVVIRARSASYDPATSEVVAQGDVLLLDATRALQADAVRAVLNGPFEAEGIVAVLKGEVVDLTTAGTFAEARARGANRASLSGERVEGDAGGRLRLSGARVTLCDCGAGRAPSWELRARKADVVPGKRATLSWPVLYVTPRFLGARRPVPVLAVPWLYLPLGDRQTGLLFPELGRTAVTGFSYGQPLFVTLGRSADATLTPEYFFGPGDSDRAKGAVAGPGARLELRWAPAQQAQGEVQLRWLHDLDREPGGAGGDRFAVEGRHAQDLGPDTRLRLRLALQGDPVLVRDFGSELAARNAYYSRSDALLSHRADPLVLELGAAYLEPLTPQGRPAGFPFGVFGARVPALHRWPSAAAVLLPVEVGPFLLQGRVGASRFAPIEGTRGELAPGDPGATPPQDEPPLGDDVREASGREAVTRGEARAQLSLPFRPGGVAVVTPFVRGAALGYAFDAGGAPSATAWGVGGLDVSAELSRRYGEALHRITPSLALLAGTGAARWRRGAPYPAFDLWDREAGEPGAVAPVQRLSAAPPGGFAQLRAGLDSTLTAGAAGHLQVALGQDLDLRRGRLAESALSFSAGRGPVTAGAQASVLAFGDRPPRSPLRRYRSGLDAFTRLDVNAAVQDARGDALTGALSAVGPGAVGAQAAGVDALFDLRPGRQAAAAIARLGARGVLGGAHAGYEAQLAVRRTDLPCGRSRDAGAVVQQNASLVWDSPCHCFTAGVKVSLDACGGFSQSFELDLSRLLQGGRTR